MTYDAFTFAIGLTIATLFVLGLLTSVVPWTRRRLSLGKAVPGLMVSLGIFGTFLGIFLGLQGFDVTNIDASVPLLLEGLKVAFATSLMGLAAAWIYRFIFACIPVRAASTSRDPFDLLAHQTTLLDAIRADMAGLRGRGLDTLDAIKRGITDTQDASLIGQVRNLRTDLADRLREQTNTLEAAQREAGEFSRNGFATIRDEIRDFRHQLAENNAKAIVEALEGALREFNERLAEKIGDNFKHLNEAVGRLVVWQENYRAHLETFQERLERAVAGVEANEAALKRIADEAQTIPPTMERIAAIVETARHQLDDMTRHLEAFAHLRGQAGEAFPVIERNLQGLTEGFAAAVKESTEVARRSVEAQARTMEETAHEASARLQQAAVKQAAEMEGVMEGVRGQMEQALQKVREGVDEQNKAMLRSIEEVMEKISRSTARQAGEIDGAVQQMREQFRHAIDQSNKTLEKRLNVLDTQMQEELLRVIKLMGEKLAGVSAHLVSDYQQFMTHLRPIIEGLRDARRTNGHA